MVIIYPNHWESGWLDGKAPDLCSMGPQFESKNHESIFFLLVHPTKKCVPYQWVREKMKRPGKVLTTHTPFPYRP